MNVQAMLDTHPGRTRLDLNALAACVEACFECAQTCTACADACLAEDNVKDMRRCIRTDLDCADVCVATGRILSRQTETNWRLVRSQIEACAQACRICGDECEEHADRMDHCRVCAEHCRRCEQACQKLLSSLPAGQA